MSRVIPAPPGLMGSTAGADPVRVRFPASPQAIKRRRSNAAGERAEKLAEEYYLLMGCLVSRAVKATAWVFDKATRQNKPMAVAHDYFGIWDLCVVYPIGSSAPGRVEFVQVTSPEGLSARRRKIAVAEWPPRNDVLLAFVGRGLFEVYRGPGYKVKEAEYFRRPA